MTRSSPSTGGAGGVALGANVLLVGLIVCGLGFGIGAGALQGSGAAFAFVMAVWVLGLCLQAFGPVLAARRWAALEAESIARDSLVLDPLRAPNPVATMVLPVVFTILAGLGFPGGVPGVEPRGLDRRRRSAMAAAGPAASAAFLMALVGLYALTGAGSEVLRAVLAVSVLFQGTGLVLGLMPVPGLAGYGIVRPWLSGAWLPGAWLSGAWAWTDRMARHSGLVLLGLFLLSGAFARPLFRVSLRLTAGLGIDLADVIAGYRLVRLW